MLLAELTWKQVSQLDRSTVVLIPFGAIEQHGLHLPLETDSLIATELARRVDSACNSELLVLPTQWLGLSTHHIGFSGTITAYVETYLALATEIVDSIAKAGFQKLLLLNAHGGNCSALDVVLTKCRLLHPAARIILISYWNAAAHALSTIRESPLGGMGHACELETSLVMATKPEAVQTDKMQSDGWWSQSEFLGKDMLSGGAASISRAFTEVSKNGGVGDPRTATAEKGERFYDAIVSRLVALTHDLQTEKIDRVKVVGT